MLILAGVLLAALAWSLGQRLAQLADPVNPLNFLQTGSLAGLALFAAWGFLIKDPPLFVRYGEHRRVLDENEELRAEIRRMRGVTGAATDVVEHAADLASQLADALRKGGVG